MRVAEVEANDAEYLTDSVLKNDTKDADEDAETCDSNKNPPEDTGLFINIDKCVEVGLRGTLIYTEDIKYHVVREEEKFAGPLRAQHLLDRLIHHDVAVKYRVLGFVDGVGGPGGEKITTIAHVVALHSHVVGFRQLLALGLCWEFEYIYHDVAGLVIIA